MISLFIVWDVQRKESFHTFFTISSVENYTISFSRILKSCSYLKKKKEVFQFYVFCGSHRTVVVFALLQGVQKAVH